MLRPARASGGAAAGDGVSPYPASGPDRAPRVLDRVGLAGHVGRVFQGPSGGEQQPSHLARVLAKVWQPGAVGRPRWRLLDEPVDTLDSDHQVQIMRLAQDFARAGDAFVAVTQDMNPTAMLAGRIRLLHGGPALVSGAPADAIVSTAYGCAQHRSTQPRDGGAVLMLAMNRARVTPAAAQTAGVSTLPGRIIPLSAACRSRTRNTTRARSSTRRPSIDGPRGPASSRLQGAGAIGGIVAFEPRDAADFLTAGSDTARRLRNGGASKGGALSGSAILGHRSNARVKALGRADHPQRTAPRGPSRGSTASPRRTPPLRCSTMPVEPCVWTCATPSAQRRNLAKRPDPRCVRSADQIHPERAADPARRPAFQPQPQRDHRRRRCRIDEHFSLQAPHNASGLTLWPEQSLSAEVGFA